MQCGCNSAGIYTHILGLVSNFQLILRMPKKGK